MDKILNNIIIVLVIAFNIWLWKDLITNLHTSREKENGQ